MKKLKILFLSILISCLPLFLFSQSSIITTGIVIAGNSWSVLKYGLVLGQNTNGMPENYLCCINTEQFTTKEDSMFNGVIYKKVFYNTTTQQDKFEGLIRASDKHIYFISANTSTENLLYDFSVDDGNRVTFFDYRNGNTQNLYAKVDSVDVNGILKKRIRLSLSPNENYSFIDTWIEDIGSLHGLLYAGVPLAGGGTSLLCFSEGQTTIYQNPLFPKTYYSNEDLNTVANILGYPVQTGLQDNKDNKISIKRKSDKITIYSANETFLQIEIFNALGQKVYSDKKIGNRYEIRTSFLTNGSCFVKIQLKNRQVYDFKFIQK